MSDVGKWLGGQDIEIGDPAFDRDFIIKGANTLKVQYLFANARIRERRALMSSAFMSSG